MCTCRLLAAPAFGAHRALTPSQALAEHLVADVVVECAGVVPAFETAVKLTAPGGRTVTVGLPAPTAQARMSPLDLVSGAREIVGSYLGSAVPSRDIPYYETLWRTGKLPLEKLISTHIPLSEVNAGFDALARERVERADRAREIKVSSELSAAVAQLSQLSASIERQKGEFEAKLGEAISRSSTSSSVSEPFTARRTLTS